MKRVEQEISWDADGHPNRIGITLNGHGPLNLILPAYSSISTRTELWPLQELLGEHFSTVSIDWPGFGNLPRPKVDWRPELYRAFLQHVVESVVQPEVTVAAGHAAGYALTQAANTLGSLGRLCLLAPTWRGPLPTMAGSRKPIFRTIAKSVDLPVLGSAFYRLNVSKPVMNKMSNGHVYTSPNWLTPERMADKLRVAHAPGARHSSFRFVAGELDPYLGRQEFLDDASRIDDDVLVVYSGAGPRKSTAEIKALVNLRNVVGVKVPLGKLSFYEEFASQAADPIVEFWEHSRA